MLDFVASTCFCPKYTQRPPILQWAAWRLILVAPGVTFLRRHTLNTLKPLTPPNIHLHGSLCDTPPHKHSHSIRGRSKHTSGADAAASLCSETLMSAAVRQQLIVMLISKLLPPSLHSFSSSFVLSLSLSPPSLSSSPLHSAVISVSPPSGFLSHPPSVSLSITSPLLFLCLLSPSFSRSLLLSVLSDVTLPSIPSSLSSLFFIFLHPPLLSSPYRQALLRGLSETLCQLFRTHSVCKYVCVCRCMCVQTMHLGTAVNSVLCYKPLTDLIRGYLEERKKG